MEAQFIKAYCEKSRRYYGLRVENVDGTNQVTDFYDIDSSLAKTLGSTITATSIQAAPNLRECYGCGSRTVAGCSCAKRNWQCAQGVSYHYQCLFCQELRLFAKEEGAEVYDESNLGKQVRLAQGQEVVISAAGPSALEHILVGVGWDVALQGANMDVDSSVFVQNSHTGDFEIVYYGNLTHSAGCVIHRGDNLTGGKNEDNASSEDSENIDVLLNRVPEEFDELYFVVNIYNCTERGQSFKDVRNLYIRLTNGKTGQLLAEYRVEQGLLDKTGLIIGKAYRKGDEWVFRAIGQGVRVKTVLGMHSFCKD